MASEQTAQNARAEAGAVADTVREETKNVAQQAQQQATSALHQVQGDVRSRADVEAQKFAQTLHDTSRQLGSMAGAANEQGMASNLVREGANATERLASRLDESGIDGVMADMRSWARRRPGAFLFGAVAAGFVTGRVVRNLSSDGQMAPQNGGNGFRTLPATTATGEFEATSLRDKGSTP
jgi:hypothetical protein